jgi:hypothetical protein
VRLSGAWLVGPVFLRKAQAFEDTRYLTEVDTYSQYSQPFLKRQDRGADMHRTSFPPHQIQNFPSLSSIYTLIPSLRISIRKELLTACRVQQHPSSNVRLRSSMPLWYSGLIQHPTTPGIMQQLTDYNKDLQEVLDSPLYSSFISMALACVSLYVLGSSALLDGFARISSVSGK